MNIKKYRAATTREALERVKQDLGEDAFVLETKKINTGGFLGLQKETQIEISAAIPAFNFPTNSARVGASAQTGERLILQEDSPASPSFPKAKKLTRKEKIINALTARALPGRKDDKKIFSLNETNGTDEADVLTDFEENLEPVSAEKTEAEIETVEISAEAPKVVHTRKSMKKTKSPEKETLESAEILETAVPKSTKRELELLRAELREVKLSLSSLSTRKNTLALQTDAGELAKEFDTPFYESFLELVSTGLKPELSHQAVTDNLPKTKRKKKISKDEKLTEKILLQVISDRVSFEFSPIKTDEPKMLALIGTTGVGKTTTIAKLAARAALHNNCRVELVTLDTYRIAAVEQLKTYAEIIGAGCHIVRSVFELDATLRRLPEDATVLIDTTGKSPHDLADQHELADYLNRRKKIRKCLALQANTDPADALLTINRFEIYGADSLILTKLDETVRPGSMIEAISESALPLAYLCMGQRVPEDLRIATPQEFAAQILRKEIQTDDCQ